MKELRIKTTITIKPSTLDDGRKLAQKSGRSFSNYLENYISEESKTKLQKNAEILSK